VNRIDWTQRADSTASFAITWDTEGGPVDVRANAMVTLDVQPEAFEIDITVVAIHGDSVVAKRSWTRSIARQLA
jgi:hypothetical protein